MLLFHQLKNSLNGIAEEESNIDIVSPFNWQYTLSSDKAIEALQIVFLRLCASRTCEQREGVYTLVDILGNDAVMNLVSDPPMSHKLVKCLVSLCINSLDSETMRCAMLACNELFSRHPQLIALIGEKMKQIVVVLIDFCKNSDNVNEMHMSRQAGELLYHLCMSENAAGSVCSLFGEESELYTALKNAVSLLHLSANEDSAILMDMCGYYTESMNRIRVALVDLYC